MNIENIKEKSPWGKEKLDVTVFELDFDEVKEMINLFSIMTEDLLLLKTKKKLAVGHESCICGDFKTETKIFLKLNNKIKNKDFSKKNFKTDFTKKKVIHDNLFNNPYITIPMLSKHFKKREENTKLIDKISKVIGKNINFIYKVKLI